MRVDRAGVASAWHRAADKAEALRLTCGRMLLPTMTSNQLSGPLRLHACT